jgi:hypothetical protein
VIFSERQAMAPETLEHIHLLWTNWRIWMSPTPMPPLTG